MPGLQAEQPSNPKLLARVHEAIDQRRDSMVTLLTDMVRERSTLGNEYSAQKLIHTKWQSLGLQSKMWEPTVEAMSTHPAFAPVEWGYEGRPNTTAVLRAVAPGGRSLVLNGHMDVVSAEPVSAWTVDPWEGRVIGSRMYGRGAGDMKGGIAMAALAVEGLLAAGVALRGDLTLETVIEEECSGNGTLACRLAGYTADGAVVCEPTSLGAGTATMGVMWFRVTVKGVGSHVAGAHLAVNAIEKCFPLVAALRELEAEMNASVSHPLYRGVAHPINLNVGKMHGGDWPSSVPALCEFDCRISYEPGVSPFDVRRRIEERIARAAARDPWLARTPPVVSYYGFRSDGWVLERDSALVRTLRDCHRNLVGAEMLFEAATATDDTRYFSNYFGIPAICYGPAAAALHTADEYVELDSIVLGAKVLADFVTQWCGVAE